MAHMYQYDPRRYASRTTQTMDNTYSMTSRTTTTVKAALQLRRPQLGKKLAHSNLF